METLHHNRPILFANSGVQCICVPISAGLHFGVEQIGLGWQHCKYDSAGEAAELGYIQWQIIPGQNKLFLAVDTTIGTTDDVGYFAKASSLGGDFTQRLTRLLGVNGQVLEGLPDVEFVIRSATAEGGEPKDVDIVVDFGNSRTGALLLEFQGDTVREPLMNPFQLVNRYHLDSWDKSGSFQRDSSAWWFSSKSYWCTSPYLTPPRIEKIVYDEAEDSKGGFLGLGKRRPVEKTEFVIPDTFQDISMVRMGREADDLAMVMRTDGEVRTGVSSPKRYLWAQDDSWLDGANWHMADPFGQYNSEDHATTLKGPLLKFLPEDDRPDEPRPRHVEAPSKPRHAPRVMMVGALYELLCQAYTYVNSPTYRHATGEAGRLRQLRSMTLTYPSGMIAAERQQLAKQAAKAISIFCQTLGKHQPAPELKLSIDEASAVHLTYIWSEVQKLGRNPSLWFSLMGGGHEKPAAAEPADEQPATEPADNSGAPRRATRLRRPGREKGRGRAEQPPAGSQSELRIACIDIGGGTSDLMIAKYVCESHVGGDQIRGETLHRDGISVAGDHLVARLLERVIVPAFASSIGMEDSDVQRLFGPEVPGWNREFRAQRIKWMNQLFVPLAQAYLDNAVDDTDDEISHTDPDIVGPEVRESLQKTINKVFGPGTYNLGQPLDLRYEKDVFEDVVFEVFDDLVSDFCESIVEHKADVVLLAGQPSKLRYLQELVETYLPLPKSRIIPMFQWYAGTWYPYQNPDEMNPGVIVDPKSTVVVGAAIEFCARHGMLPQFKFKMTDEAAKRSYYWGLMTESRIDDKRILFRPETDGKTRISQTEFSVSDQRVIIGRKRRAYENAQASPVYLLKVDTGRRIGEIDLKVILQRGTDTNGEEQLSLLAVDGVVAGQPAILGKNVSFEWRTLADEKYYLDTGGLSRIELE